MIRSMRHCGHLAATCGMLFFAVAAAAAQPPVGAAHQIGTLDGAAYRIDVPAHWNHRLVVFFHGYTEAPVIFRKGETVSAIFDPSLVHGYAVIQSGYAQGGWAVQQAATDTERLRRLFIAQYGAPTQTLVMGMSMGGTLTVMTIEQHPDVYAAHCHCAAPSSPATGWCRATLRCAPPSTTTSPACWALWCRWPRAIAPMR